MEKDTRSLCRICFEIGHFSLSGYEISMQGKNLSIEEMIKRFSDLKFIDENIPDLICENCTHDLVQSYLFSEKVLESDAQILNLVTQKEHDKIIVYEEELNTPETEANKIFDGQIIKEESIENQIIEEQNFEDQNLEEQNFDEENNEKSQPIEENEPTDDHIVFEEDQIDFIEEIAEPNEMDEMYTECDSQSVGYIVADEEEELSDFTEIDNSHKMSSKMARLSNFDSSIVEENIDSQKPSKEPRRKYQRRHKENNKIDVNGSFVVTQFASSTSAPGNLLNVNNNTDDSEDVPVSDVRIMNYETVEVKAENIDLLEQIAQSELPIDESRVYLCQYCPRAFSSSVFLTAHVRKTHGCKYCASVFEKAKDLYAHIREAHTKFECVVCGKEFTSNSNMRNHLKNVHKVKVPANVSLISYKRHSENEEEI